DIFREGNNYIYFLKLAIKHILPVADVYSYCLLKNHFHFLVKIKPIENLQVEQNFSNFFNAYAKAFNKKYNRTGKLFEERFKRKKVNEDSYLTQLIYYIHSNPQKHKLLNDFRNYQYSSYRALASSKKTELKRKEVLEWFGGVEAFEKYHLEKQYVLASDMAFEDFLKF
ncbi:MAG: transposase, partial [Pedobacter sp.]